MPHPKIPDIPPAVPDQDVAVDQNAAGRCNAGLQARNSHKKEIHMTKKKVCMISKQVYFRILIFKTSSLLHGKLLLLQG